MAADNSKSPPPWHAAYPAPRNANVATIDREAVLQMLKLRSSTQEDFVLIDVRRNDHEVITSLPFCSVYLSKCLHVQSSYLPCYTGRYYKRLNKSSCAELVSLDSDDVQTFQVGQCSQGHLVLL